MTLAEVLKAHQGEYGRVVPFDPEQDRLYPFDFTEANTALTPEMVADTESFAGYINRTLQEQKARYGIGGYGEHRTIYSRSKHFDTASDQPGATDFSGTASTGVAASAATASGHLVAGGETPRVSNEPEPRRLHLGVDIWGPAGTKVMAPLDGIVHSFAFNNNDSDYGATLILTHRLDGIGFHSLYGHLSLNSLKNLHEGKRMQKGDVIGEYGMRFENGNWPPHLHFQLIADMQDRKGDYPGVCRYSERQQWLDNSPDPGLILQMR